MAKDPVCGMMVTTGEAAGKSDYQGHSYYFCSPACKEAFDHKPQVYAVKKAAEQEPPTEVT